MIKQFNLGEIKQAIGDDLSVVIEAIRQCFVEEEQKRIHLQPVLHIGSDDMPLKGGGLVHIKTGHAHKGDHIIVKIAGGQFQGHGNSGAIIVLSQESGAMKAILHDEGYLTDLRTAAAGALSTQVFGPKHIRRIGVIGTGVQSRFQILFHGTVTGCRNLMIYGRSIQKAKVLAKEFCEVGWRAEVAGDIAELCRECDVVITVTASRHALVQPYMVRAGMHFVCMGSDAKGKQELHPEILENADRVVVDDECQCRESGELQYTRRNLEVVKFGKLLLHQKSYRNEEDITVFDSTGLAAQDVAIAKLALKLLKI